MNRRDVLHTMAATSAAPLLSSRGVASMKQKKSQFRLCLNTSTISGQKAPIDKYVEIAARAGYDSIEIWVADVKAYVANGGSLQKLKKLLNDSHVSPVDAIGFAPWMTDDDEQRKAGFKQMREEMQMVADLNCPRIAAPAAGVKTPTRICSKSASGITSYSPWEEKRASRRNSRSGDRLCFITSARQ